MASAGVVRHLICTVKRPVLSQSSSRVCWIHSHGLLTRRCSPRLRDPRARRLTLSYWWDWYAKLVHGPVVVR